MEPSRNGFQAVLEEAPARRLRESRTFQQLRWHMLRNSIAGHLRGSALRMATIAFCSAVIWVGVYLAAADGFRFFRLHNIVLGGGIAGTLFDAMFVFLGVLLIVSSGIILYSSLFSSAESNFLLSLPARADQVFAYKYQGAIAFSSWGFILLGSPVLVAYGVSAGAVWYFYFILLLFFVATCCCRAPSVRSAACWS